MVGSGMTAAINKWQRILGLRIPEQYQTKVVLSPEQRPVVFVTHMEHHSNQTTWIETIAEVVVIEPNSEGLVCLENLRNLLDTYQNRPLKIAAITACSNITGIQTPYHDVARIMHENEGFCFVDFACSAPYVAINMHPTDPMERLDAIYFSPHKFLGGPGTPGVLVFNKDLYTLKIPDQPGGGTVRWTNPWGEHSYYDDIEAREDGGTPPFLQTIKTALCIKLKEEIGVDNILAREEELLNLFLPRFREIKGLSILADNQPHRLSIISFYIKGLHYNLGVKLLNDRFGVQARGGCSCAGTYGHYLLNVTLEHSHSITDKINAGDLSEKPGWIRISLHPTMTNAEAEFLLNAITQVAENFEKWSEDYVYDSHTNEFESKHKDTQTAKTVKAWFQL
jgi:selenocysteine lyase/cysteine desulfurase